MAKISIIFLVAYAACAFDQTAGLNFFYQANPVYEDLQSYPYISPYAAIWKPECDEEENSGESSESSSSESSESSENSESSESKESKESSKSSKESSSESGSKGSKESGESKNSSESTSAEEKEGSSKEEEEESKSKSSEGSSEGSEEKRKETPKKKKKKERHPLFPPRPYPFPARQVQRIMYSPTSSLSSAYAYLPYRQASPYVVQQPFMKSNIQYMPVPATQSYVRYSPPVVGKSISGPVQKIVYSAAPALNYPSVSKTIISSEGRAYPVAGSWSSPFTYLKK